MLSLRCLWNTHVGLLNLSLGFREVGAGEKHLGDVSLSTVIKAVGKEWNYGGKEKREEKGAKV